MSAMLDTYDMQMLDYSGDHDVQMHPSSSDQWFQDEAKMEEDGPKSESDGHLKTDIYTQEKSDATIEVDMEPSLDSHNTEYDMLDAEEIQDGEILDIEVYDASHIQSPAMFAVDSAQGEIFHQAFEAPVLGSAFNESISTAPIEPLNPPLESSEAHPIVSNETSSAPETFVDAHIYESELEEHPAVSVATLESAAELSKADPDPSLKFHTAEAVENPAEVGEHSTQDDEHSTAGLTSAESLEQSLDSAVEEPVTHVVSNDNEALDNADTANVHDPTESIVVPGDNASSGDPHEISEGVYIDPPPPVLLSLGSDDGFGFSLFNEPSSWSEGIQKGAEITQSDDVLLHHFPTLYYEPLSTVFEALRHDEYIQSVFPVAEAELSLEALDLRLTLSEDNIYAREVTLHDLNVLHDVSGINGLLRVRLFSTSPRFITRYQHLQSEVSRLDLGLSAEELPVNAGDLPSSDELHEQPREYELTDDQASHEQEEQPSHDVEGHTAQEESPNQGEDQHDYEVYEHVSESASNVLERSEAFDANEEATSFDEQKTTDQTNVSRPILTQDSSSDQYLVDSNEKEDEGDEGETEPQTPTHHSTPTSRSRDIGTSVHKDEDTGVIPLETDESNSRDGGEYAEDAHSFDEHKEEDGFQYPEYDEDEGQEDFGDEEYQKDQGEYQDEYANEQPQELDQQEDQEEIQPQHPEDSYQTQKQGVDQFLLTTTDETQQFVSSEAPKVSESEEPENELPYEQTSTVDQDASYNEEGEYVDDVDATFDHSAVADPTEELSHIRATEQVLHDTADPLESHPEFIEGEWEDDLDGEGEIDETWDEDNEVETAQSHSNNSSVTLSSKASKRSYDEFDSDGDGDEDADSHRGTSPGSPGLKRSRTQ